MLENKICTAHVLVCNNCSCSIAVDEGSPSYMSKNDSQEGSEHNGQVGK